MSDYDDYRKDEELFLQNLDDLAAARNEAEWKRRLTDLAKRLDKPQAELLRVRRRIIRQARELRPDFSESDAATWVDGVIGLDPRN